MGSKFPTVTTSKLKAYGAGGYVIEDGEAIAGCPRLYRARYVDHRRESKGEIAGTPVVGEVVEEGELTEDEKLANAAAVQDSPVLHYGRAVHEALYLMEEEMISLDEALQRSWPQQLGPDELSRAKRDIEHYMERGGLTARISTMAVERSLTTELYIDEQFGRVDFGGIIDWLGIEEIEDTGRFDVHVGDYKSGFTVPKQADIEGDIQGKGYTFLVRQCWKELGFDQPPRRIIFHLDAVRWRDLEHEFTNHEVDEWAAWTEAIARKILRDEAAEPVLNPHCGYCPIKFSCKAYRGLPGRGPSLPEQMTAVPLDKLLAWQQEAKDTIRMLTKGKEEVDGILQARVEAEGGAVQIGSKVYESVAKEVGEWDMRGLYDDMGWDFIEEVATVTKTGVEAALTRRGQRLRGHEIERYLSTVPNGTRVKARKASE